MPSISGRVIPNHELSGAGGVTVNVSVNNEGGVSSDRSSRSGEFGRMIGAAVVGHHIELPAEAMDDRFIDQLRREGKHHSSLCHLILHFRSTGKI